MADIRRRLERLEKGRLCPAHPQQRLLCMKCDMLPLPADGWEVLGHFVQQAGYLDREAAKSAGDCWRCGNKDTLVGCLLCLEARVEPAEVELMDAKDLDRLHELGAKLVPLWLTFNP